MLMYLISSFFFTSQCKHEKVTPNLDFMYCPDCGKLIKNEWYITRCACCGIKLVTKIQNDKIIPESTYCQNCGSNNYEVEKIDKINFIDINYAVLIKKEVEAHSQTTSTQCWQERTIEKPKLLTQFL